MYEIFRATDGLYVANNGQLVLKVMLNDLFMAEKLCNLLNAAQQTLTHDAANVAHKEWCIGGDKGPCNCGAQQDRRAGKA